MSSLQASYIVIHNGSGEILDASVDLTLGTLSSQQAIVLQTFKVRFVMVGLSASLTLFPQPILSSLTVQTFVLRATICWAGPGSKATTSCCVVSVKPNATILSIRIVHTKQN